MISDSQGISDAFNSYFSNIAVDLESSLPESSEDFMQYMQGNYLNSIAIPDTSPNDIQLIINQLKNKACSVDDISIRVIKQNAHILSQPLSKLFNQSVHTGTFPKQLKHTRITPIYKKGSRSDINNYRPI